jgi:hypothetical protein
MIRRGAPIRYKRKVRKVSWRSGKIREDAVGMTRLRSAAFRRSKGVCECGFDLRSHTSQGCTRAVTWLDGHLHHVVSRGRGGSDTLDNVLFINSACHRRITGEPQWTTFKKRSVGE